jgi:glycosyltransferase involved in cell wall biosynthesis
MPHENKVNLSIVVPIYNEERYIKKLFIDITKHFDQNNIEVIFVNDGSSDESKEIIENLQKTKNYQFSFALISLEKNAGKGHAVRKGMKASKGKYILLHDADLELDIKDSKEIYNIINNNDEIKCIFGSRYLSGKLKKHNYFINQFIGKFNTLIFNILFSQSLTDLHCGLKIIHRDVYEKINLTLNDFGLEIDIASQIIKNNFYIYEVGVSYFSRSVKSGKKITWIDGIKSYYYLFKVRFLDNNLSTQISIILSFMYMGFVGTYFGMGTGKTFFIIIFAIFGLFIGLKTKPISSLTIFLFIYIGSLFGNGQGKVLSVTLFFLIGLFIVRKLKRKIDYKNQLISSLF